MEDRERTLITARRPCPVRASMQALLALTVCLLSATTASADIVEQAVARLNRGEYKEAVGDLEAASAQKVPGASLALARAYLEVGRYDDARTVASGLEAADKRSDESREAAIVVAITEAVHGDYKAAITRLKAVVKAKPRLLEARVRLAELRHLTGTPRSALTEADQIADFYDAGEVTSARDLIWAGRALALTEYYKNANDVFSEALDIDRSDLLGHFYWAQLFLTAGENEKEADVSVQEILKRNAKHPGAWVLSALMDISSDNDASKALQSAAKALAVNPNLIEAHQVRARAFIETEQYDAALKALEPALTLNPAEPVSLALQASTQLLKEDEAAFQATMKRALVTNPKFAEGWHIVAEIVERRHRYDDSIAFERRAIALDPEYWPAWVGLGVGLSRAGNDAEAEKTLAEAFEGDSFNVRAYNMIEFFYDGPAKRMDWVKGPHFDLRLDREERAVLEPLVPPLLEDAWGYYAKRYGFEPGKPLHVEYFPERPVFAVRTVGTPGLAAHGVCFGHVVSVASPSNADHNWRMVVWHELAHIWHHQMSRGRVPRWFTEGLAELETTLRKPYWKRELDSELWTALEAGKLEGIEKFNTMFTQAQSIDEIVLAYYYATQVVRFIDGKWGGGVFAKMLTAWGNKKPTEVVFREVLNTSLDEFDAAMRAYLESTWLVRFKGSFDPTSLPDTDPSAGVLTTLRKQMSDKDPAAAAKTLDELIEAGKDGVVIRKLRAAVAQQQEDWAAMEASARRAETFDPQDLEALGQIRAAQQKLGDARGEFETMKRLAENQEDNVELLLEVVDKASKLGDVPAIIEYAERALEVAPFNPNVIAALEMARTAVLDGARIRHRSARTHTPARPHVAAPLATW